MKIILASQSAARRKALDLLGLTYEVAPSNIDEKTVRNSNPHKLAQRLAEAKALAIGKNQRDSVIIAADLFVTLDDQIYEKPATTEEARKMLSAFSGRKLEIISGLAVFNSTTKKMASATETCEVKFRTLRDAEIEDYIAKYPVLNFAGAFDGDGMIRFAEHIKGNYNFATGLPMNKLIEFLRENNVKV